MVRKRAARLVSLFGIATMLTGFSQRATADDDDPPSRVARLAYASGSVSFQPAGTDDWVMAGLNRPVTTGDKLWSDNDGRVELQIDGSLIRLSNNTGLSFLNLGDNVTQIQVSAGTVLVRVRRLDDTETYEIDTPNLAFSVLRPGLYRITVNEAGDSTAIRIRSGEGEVTGGGSAYAVHANEYATFSGTDQLSASSGRYGNDDDQFGSWAANRDRHSEISSSAQYVSADVVGYEDLDDHGSWRQTTDNGTVWFPRTAVPGWAPYHYGHWDYIEPWGYTWVDDEPWGFAPFHYGRWVFYEGSWGWVPAPPRSRGVVYVRPVYAPALVAWVGGPHFAIGFAVGAGYAPDVSVGWFPLGPREVYVPSYRVSRNYVNNVNVSNTTVTTTVVNNYYNTTVVNNNSVNTTNVRYINQHVPGAVAATTPRAFTSAQPVARNAVKLDQREVAAAPAMALTPGVAPAKQAVLGTGAAVARPPAALQTRAVVAKVAPPPPPPSFEKRQEAIKSNGGRPLSVAQVRQIEPVPAHREALVRIAPAAKPVTPQVSQTNRPVQSQNGAPAQVTPNAGNVAVEPPSRPADRSTARPVNPNNATQPVQANRPAPPAAIHPSEIPTPPQPVIQPSANAELDRKHQQEQDQLRAQQVQERQRVQQQQEQEHAKLAQQQADAAQKQQVEQQHQRQTQQLQQKYAEEQKLLLEKQRQERQITAQASQTNRPVQPQNGVPAQVAPNAGNVAVEPPNRSADRSTARPVNPNNAAQPAQANRPAPPAVHPSEIPISPRPVIQPSANAELDRKHQQEQDQLRAQQAQDRQRVQQQQEQEHARLAQQQADAAQKQRAEQQHQQQTQRLQQQHAEEQKVLQEKQRQERQKQSKP